MTMNIAASLPAPRTSISPLPQLVIAGASGFIGAAIVQRAVENDWPAPIVILRSDSQPARLKSLLSRCKVFRSENLNNRPTLERLVGFQPQVWMQVGWQGVFGKDRDDARQLTTNLPLVLRSLELARAAGCRKWIGFGSQAEYGRYAEPIAESFHARPHTVYGAAKLAALWASSAYAQATALDHCWLRVFSTYGPSDEPHWLIPHIIGSLQRGLAPKLTPCEQIWDYLYVEDAADAALAAAASGATGVFNVASGRGVPLKEIVTKIVSAMTPNQGVEFGGLSYAENQVFHLVGDITKLTSATGWVPRVPLDEGLRRTIAYFSSRS